MSALRLRLVRTDEPPLYRRAPGWARRRLQVWHQRWDRRQELNQEMRSQRCSIQVTCRDDQPGDHLMPGASWNGPLSALPRPLRRKARRNLIAYYCLSKSASSGYPWTPLPGDPRSRTVDVRS